MDPFNIFLIVMAVGTVIGLILFARSNGKSKSRGSRFSPDISGSRSPFSNSTDLADAMIDEVSEGTGSGRRRSGSAAAAAAVSSPVHSDSGSFSGGGGFSGGGDCGGGGGGGGCF